MKKKQNISILILVVFLCIFGAGRMVVMKWTKTKTKDKLAAMIISSDSVDRIIADPIPPSIVNEKQHESSHEPKRQEEHKEEKAVIEHRVRHTATTKDEKEVDSKPLARKSWRQEKRDPIDINQADSILLKTIYGIGPVLSKRIVAFRQRLGGFHSIEQLREVYGLSEESFQAIKPQIKCDGRVTILDPAKDKFKAILRHPYLEYEEVKSLFRHVQEGHELFSVEDVIKATGKSKQEAENIFPYLRQSTTLANRN